MDLKEKFSLIGFTDFVYPNIELRDGKERLCFNSKYEDEWVFILLVKDNDTWRIEKIEDNDEISKVLNRTKSSLNCEDLICFFKEYYYVNSDISAIL